MKEGVDNVKVITMKIVDDKAMKAFFEKYPIDLKESIALKMIVDKMESSEKKCEKKDPDYIEDAAIAYHMLTDFFQEKGVDPLIY